MSPSPPSKARTIRSRSKIQPSGIVRKSGSNKHSNAGSSRPQSHAAEVIRAHRILESVAAEDEIDERVGAAENERLRAELKARQLQLRWAIERCIYLEKKYGVKKEDKIYRPRPPKRGGGKGYSVSQVARIVMVKTASLGEGDGEDDMEEDMEKEEKIDEEEFKHKMPGMWVV